MPQREKYVPQHRGEADHTALKNSVRNTLVLSGVAAAATTGTVATGVLSTGLSGAAAASDLSHSQSDSKVTVEQLVQRQAQFSRSADRRDGGKDAKAAELSDSKAVATVETHSVDLSDPEAIAKSLMPQFGMDPATQFSCLDRIWSQESGWNVHAANPTSSAYGIPQALPGSKMASAGADWQNNPVTQIKWGLGYIKERYGSACAAWGFKAGHGWY